MTLISNNRLSLKISYIIVLFTIFILINSTATCNNNYSDLRTQISQPGLIPEFTDFETLKLASGESGVLQFNITNRYDFSNDNTIKNVSLKINIYNYVTFESSSGLEDIKESPKIVSGNSAFRDTINQWTAEFNWEEISEGRYVPVELKIKTFSGTPEGIYLIRMHLNFSFNDTYFDMKSRGYFPDEQWERAYASIANHSETDDDKFIIGRLDLNVLDVDGIIPDTSFSVNGSIAETKDGFKGNVMILIIIISVALAIILIYFWKKKRSRPNDNQPR